MKPEYRESHISWGLGQWPVSQGTGLLHRTNLTEEGVAIILGANEARACYRSERCEYSGNGNSYPME